MNIQDIVLVRNYHADKLTGLIDPADFSSPVTEYKTGWNYELKSFVPFDSNNSKYTSDMGTFLQIRLSFTMNKLLILNLTFDIAK